MSARTKCEKCGYWVDERTGIPLCEVCVGKTTRPTVEALQAENARLTLERDEALAHDRQPYPTAAAYDAVCETLRVRTIERDAARRDWDEAVREKPFLHPALEKALKERDEARKRANQFRVDAEGRRLALEDALAREAGLREALERIYEWHDDGTAPTTFTAGHPYTLARMALAPVPPPAPRMDEEPCSLPEPCSLHPRVLPPRTVPLAVARPVLLLAIGAMELVLPSDMDAWADIGRCGVYDGDDDCSCSEEARRASIRSAFSSALAALRKAVGP